MSQPVSTLDLCRFGMSGDIQLYGTIQGEWSGGKRLVFLFGENHHDREMKRLFILNACKLYDLDLVCCAGTEVPMVDLDNLSVDNINAKSKELFDKHQTDDAVLEYLQQFQPWWYGGFEFGNSLKMMRPSLPVICVEDPLLRRQMKPIFEFYELADLGVVPHPTPEYPKVADHPHNLKREQAMIEALFALWDNSLQTQAAILNTGLAHCARIAGLIQERGVNFIVISMPASSLII